MCLYIFFAPPPPHQVVLWCAQEWDVSCIILELNWNERETKRETKTNGKRRKKWKAKHVANVCFFNALRFFSSLFFSRAVVVVEVFFLCWVVRTSLGNSNILTKWKGHYFNLSVTSEQKTCSSSHTHALFIFVYVWRGARGLTVVLCYVRRRSALGNSVQSTRRSLLCPFSSTPSLPQLSPRPRLL